jgi:ribose transport system permease protein
MQSKSDIAGILPPPRGNIVKIHWQDYVVYLFFLLVLAFFGLTLGDKGFLTIENLFNITRTTSMIVVMAVAMTFVICCGELDLSVGSTAGLAALAAGYVLNAGYGTLTGVLAAILCGLVVGLLNGLFVTVGNIPSFLVTLGMMQLVRGLDMRVTYTKPILITDDLFNNIFGSGSIGPCLHCSSGRFSPPRSGIWSSAIPCLVVRCSRREGTEPLPNTPE